MGSSAVILHGPRNGRGEIGFTKSQRIKCMLWSSELYTNKSSRV